MDKIYLYTVIRADNGKSWDRKAIGWDSCFDVNLLHDFGDESRWNWAVIEKSSPGICQICEVEAFYRRDDDLNIWVETKAPEWAEGLVNWGLG